MRRWLANAIVASLGLALPCWAFAQTTSPPVIPAVQSAHAKKSTANTPVWQRDGNTLSVTAGGDTGSIVPTTTTALGGGTRSTGAGIRLTTKPGLNAHANVREIHWAPLMPACAAALPGTSINPACLAPISDGVHRGEVGAGFAGHGVKLDLSVGQSQSDSAASPALRRHIVLPRVLPAEGGADVAAPLWFRNSTATSISARGQVTVAPDTSVNLGASVGHVRFMPGSGLPSEDSLDQTTLSLGIRHGSVRGAIVGHMLEPNNLPGSPLDQSQRWSGIDLGISVRLPWRGELNFGAQNVWTSGHAPLLFGPGAVTPDQGRVPYVQYHQDLW